MPQTCWCIYNTKTVPSRVEEYKEIWNILYDGGIIFTTILPPPPSSKKPIPSVCGYMMFGYAELYYCDFIYKRFWVIYEPYTQALCLYSHFTKNPFSGVDLMNTSVHTIRFPFPRCRIQIRVSIEQ